MQLGINNRHRRLVIVFFYKGWPGLFSFIFGHSMKPNNFTTNNVKNIHPVPGSELTTYQLGIPKHSDIFLKMCQPRPLLCLCLFLSTSILQKKMLTSGGFERGSSELKTRMLTTSPLPRHYLHSDTFYKLLKQRINSNEFIIGKIT